MAEETYIASRWPHNPLDAARLNMALHGLLRWHRDENDDRPAASVCRPVLEMFAKIAVQLELDERGSFVGCMGYVTRDSVVAEHTRRCDAAGQPAHLRLDFQRFYTDEVHQLCSIMYGWGFADEAVRMCGDLVCRDYGGKPAMMVAYYATTMVLSMFMETAAGSGLGGANAESAGLLIKAAQKVMDDNWAAFCGWQSNSW